MNSLLKKLSPTATNMIRMDHTHVLATFHQYEADTSHGTKEALVNTIMLALEVHAQLEEEIFYPALRPVVTTSCHRQERAEHDEMRRLMRAARDDAGRRGVRPHVHGAERDVMPTSPTKRQCCCGSERMLADELGESARR